MAVTTTKRSVMTLYSGANDLYSHRVRIVLAIKGVVVDIEEIDPELQPDKLPELNPYNSVPTLVDRDLVLFQSNVIMEYLEHRFPYPPLLTVDPVSRAKSRQMIYRIERDWYSLVNIILDGPENEKDEARQILKDSLMSLAPVFSDYEFFLSEEFSLVDCCLAPILWRLPSLGIELDAKVGKPVVDYAERVFEMDAFQASLRETERELREDV